MKPFVLYCLPHAGGSSYLFNSWIKVLDKEIECMPFEYPGRGKMLSKSPYADIQNASMDVVEQIKHTLHGRDYALFGHSMGALIAYETLDQIKKAGIDQPVHVYLSGKTAPFHSRAPEALRYKLSDELFLQEIVQLGGLPDEFVQNRELLDYFLPIIRDDFRLVETYKHQVREPIEQEVSILYGSKDSSMIGSIEDWNKIFRSTVNYHTFNGGHFFYQDYVEEIVGIINQMFRTLSIQRFS
ncbi:thioesterase II family protein [Paenibacillus silvae]|uniref:Thioesterase n=1 Tax=Paenibacillus silvae TaxID=1325358 RepID=A0A2W6P6B5_9BACL|nr:alpha/beta fold hydrolase [Paenibacillus silvae]PZT53666.1 thioesterase [Paenibacillus silvae]